MAYSFTEPSQQLPDDSNSDDSGSESDDDQTKAKNSPMMVPMADLLNHVAANNAHLEFGEDELSMVATKLISKGEQIYNTYGELSNAQLLQMYGFVEERGANFYDTVSIPVLSLYEEMSLKSKEISCATEKVDWLKQQGLEDDSDIVVGVDGILSEQEFGVLIKILPLSEESFQNYCEDSDFEEESDSDEENEPEPFKSTKFSFKKLKEVKLQASVANVFRSAVEKLTRPLIMTRAARLESLWKCSNWREERVRGLIEGQLDIFNKLHESL